VRITTRLQQAAIDRTRFRRGFSIVIRSRRRLRQEKRTSSCAGRVLKSEFGVFAKEYASAAGASSSADGVVRVRSGACLLVWAVGTGRQPPTTPIPILTFACCLRLCWPDPSADSNKTLTPGNPSLGPTETHKGLKSIRCHADHR
jgi:hypothetical protein